MVICFKAIPANETKKHATKRDNFGLTYWVFLIFIFIFVLRF